MGWPRRHCLFAHRAEGKTNNPEPRESSPLARPGIALVSIWGIVQVSGNFLVPFLLLRDPAAQ